MSLNLKNRSVTSKDGSNKSIQHSGGNSKNTSKLSPNIWLYLALPGGIIFVNMEFVEPYFCVRVLKWNNSQLSEYIYADTVTYNFLIYQFCSIYHRNMKLSKFKSLKKLKMK